MALYRNVHVSFWNDTKVIDEMTAEDRYFMLYLLSNPHTNQVGCYEISIRDISKETGYTEECIKKLLDRFDKKLKVAKYSKKTKELLVLNWYKYNWTSSPKVRACIEKELKDLKNKEFKDYIYSICIPYIYGMDTHTQEEEEEEEEQEQEEEQSNNKNNQNYKYIIDYLNKKTSKNFKSTSKKTKTLINARINEGFSVEDFKTVINNKTTEWLNDKKMEQYLRPETLFGNKFESYLNQNSKKQETSENIETVDEYIEMSRRFENV